MVNRHEGESVQMIYTYEITDLTRIGIPWIEVRGTAFNLLDLYEISGRFGFMTTFQFQEASRTANDFGRAVTGTAFYDFETKELFANYHPGGSLPDVRILRIESVDRTLSVEQKKKLKYEGVPVDDLASFSYLPYSTEAETYESGEKKIPNIIEIEADLSGIDASKLLVNYLISKNNSGDELVQFEKENLVGTLLGEHDYHIDRRILEHFGFNAENAGKNINVRIAALRVREKRGCLTTEEAAELSDLMFCKRVDAFKVVATEVQAANLTGILTPPTQDAMKTVMGAAIRFRPSILLHGKKQIYWDLASYTHIVMRHIKACQIGTFQEKTILPYKQEDLRRLIEKVLSTIDDEIRLHFSTRQNDFVRRGKMAVVFNGDHFHLRIDASGRLTQFHSVGRKS